MTTEAPECARPRCRRRLAGTAYVCPGCARHLVARLDELADLAGELQTTIARLSRSGDGGTGGDRHPLPVNLAASDEAAEVADAIAAWVWHIAEERGVPTPAGRDRLAVRARWLTGQVEWLRHHPEAEAAFAALLQASRLAERIVDRRAPRWYAGPCTAPAPPEDDAGRPKDVGEDDQLPECGEDLYAAAGAPTVRCRRCGEVFDTAERRRWLLDAAEDTLAHAELIARALTGLGVPDCTGSTVRNLAARGRIVAHGHDAAGRPVYRLGDVLEVLADVARARAEAEARRAAKAARKAAAEASAPRAPDAA